SASFFFFQAEDGRRDRNVTGVQTCALPILHDRLGGDSCQPGPESGGESGDIGVVTGRAPLPGDDDGVDRVDAPGHRVDVVEEVYDPLFERMGDVETVEAEADRRGQQLVQLRPGRPRFGDVDGAVDRGDGTGCTFDLVHSRGAGGGDAVADESEEEG